jgi:proline dehydrogenase
MIFKYISGNKFIHAFHKGSAILNQNKIPIINYAVENNISQDIIQHEFYQISKNINNNYKIALKLSLFNFDINIIKNVIDLFVKKDVKILIDAENENLHDIYNESCNQLMWDYNKNKVNILKTYQMYRKDSLDLLTHDSNYAKYNNYYHGIKLVRGAYHNEDKNKKRNDDYVLYQNKEDTDINFNQGILHIYNNPTNKYSIIASHNNESINLCHLLNKENKIFEYAHLLGMNEKKYTKLVTEKENIHVYIPYGPYKYMIPYLTRRLYENIDTIKYM